MLFIVNSGKMIVLVQICMVPLCSKYSVTFHHALHSNFHGQAIFKRGGQLRKNSNVKYDF